MRRDDLGQPAGYGEAQHHQQGRHVDATGVGGKRLFLREETCPGVDCAPWGFDGQGRKVRADRAGVSRGRTTGGDR